MKVTVNHQYAYDTGGLVVKIGDVLILPPGASDHEWKGTVTSLTSTYKGNHKTILGIMRGTTPIYLTGDFGKKRNEALIKAAHDDYLKAKDIADQKLREYHLLLATV